MEYFSIIHKYISPDAPAYRPYIIHVSMVTNKALQVAAKFDLSPEQLQFIEEASMLHDIGISQVYAPEIGCFGQLPYVAHIPEGAKILRQEGREAHARVVETHTGVGILAQDVVEHNLPLPAQDFLPETIEEEIISYADLFFSKNPGHLWEEKTWEKIEQEIVKFGSWHQQRLQYFRDKFGEK